LCGEIQKSPFQEGVHTPNFYKIITKAIENEPWYEEWEKEEIQ
jgi:hypothetical protein